MSGHDVVILLTHHGQRGEVRVDGKALTVRSVSFAAAVGAVAVVTLEVVAESIKVDVDGAQVEYVEAGDKEPLGQQTHPRGSEPAAVHPPGALTPGLRRTR